MAIITVQDTKESHNEQTRQHYMYTRQQAIKALLFNDAFTKHLARERHSDHCTTQYATHFTLQYSDCLGIFTITYLRTC